MSDHAVVVPDDVDRESDIPGIDVRISRTSCLACGGQAHRVADGSWEHGTGDLAAEIRGREGAPSAPTARAPARRRRRR